MISYNRVRTFETPCSVKHGIWPTANAAACGWACCLFAEGNEGIKSFTRGKRTLKSVNVVLISRLERKDSEAGGRARKQRKRRQLNLFYAQKFRVKPHDAFFVGLAVSMPLPPTPTPTVEPIFHFSKLRNEVRTRKAPKTRS
jgi:hypothetical protein